MGKTPGVRWERDGMEWMEQKFRGCSGIERVCPYTESTSSIYSSISIAQQCLMNIQKHWKLSIISLGIFVYSIFFLHLVRLRS